ncbi:unnamed protein product [Urochloa decumbens]|uniref:Uncharacterized protein n=1 Tax=Urochloa decumbens TaxID=240449 RepID=A0ABC8Z5N5_9POAL
MASVKAYVLLFTAFFFSGLMQLSMAQDRPANVAMMARAFDAKAIDQAIAYMLMFAALFHLEMAAVKVNVLVFTAFFFSELMQLSTAQDKPATLVTATARVVDAKAIDQAIAYLLMFAALFVTYFAH